MRFLENKQWSALYSHIIDDKRFKREYGKRVVTLSFEETVKKHLEYLFSETESPTLWYVTNTKSEDVFSYDGVVFDMQGIYDYYCYYLDFLEGKN